MGSFVERLRRRFGGSSGSPVSTATSVSGIAAEEHLTVIVGTDDGSPAAVFFRDRWLPFRVRHATDREAAALRVARYHLRRRGHESRLVGVVAVSHEGEACVTGGRVVGSRARRGDVVVEPEVSSR